MGFPVTILTPPCSHRPLSLSSVGFQNLALGFSVGLCICFHQLLCEASMMTIRVLPILQPLPSASLLRSTHLFSLPRTIHASLLGSSLLPRFSGALNCSLFIRCFSSHIYLLVSACPVCLSGSELLHSGWFFLVPFICLQIS